MLPVVTYPELVDRVVLLPIRDSVAAVISALLVHDVLAIVSVVADTALFDVHVQLDAVSVSTFAGLLDVTVLLDAKRLTTLRS